MLVDSDAEVSRLRALLRDIVALSAVPGGWVASEPRDVAAGLVDTLVGLLRLDFGFVRLCDPGGAEAVEATRGDAWSGFPVWLDRHLPDASFLRVQVIDDVGDRGSQRCVGIAVPIGVSGEGGILVAASERESFPSDSDRLLLSLAANQAAIAFQSAKRIFERTAELRRSEARLSGLLVEQRALRRVATLAAHEASQSDIFNAIAESIGELLGAEATGLLRRDPDGSALIVAARGSTQGYEVGVRERLEDDGVATRVFRTGQPARIDDLQATTDAFQAPASAVGLRSVVGVPVLVEGALWGAMIAGTTGANPMPADTESRLDRFTELMATAIANSESHARADRLAAAQAALRRVATLVAEDAPLTEVFAKAAREVANMIGDVDCGVCRDEGDGTVSKVGAWGDGVLGTLRVGELFPLDGISLAGRTIRERRYCQIDDYATTAGTIGERGKQHGIRSAAGCPIVVQGGVWGMIGVARYDEDPLPPEAEARLTQLAGLVATAIANAEARAEVQRLADEQAALRRVATLVARGAPPSAVFDSVAAEMTRLLGADGVVLGRYEPRDEVTVIASRGPQADLIPPGIRASHRDGDSVTAKVWRSGRPARFVHPEGPLGAVSAILHPAGARAAVGAPIVVDGRLWGVTVANWRGGQSPPPDTEGRMVKFVELLDTAIANADSRDQLTASRARIVTATDEARRRIERDLHDGVQQRLMSLKLRLRSTERTVAADDPFAGDLAEVGVGLDGVIEELRELSRGIHPAMLREGGLDPAIRGLARRSGVPVALRLALHGPLAEPVEVATYYVVSEALTNAAKHARATHVEVAVESHEAMLEVRIRDDGVGGADAAPNSGLTGLRDRVEALGGTITLTSPPGKGTLLHVAFPLGATGFYGETG